MDESSAPSRFVELLATRRFVVTTEEPMPKGTDTSRLLTRASRLRGLVDAVSLTDSSGAVMTMSPLGVVPALRALGLEPILQITNRDRNRIALQAELLAASAMGVQAVSCMSGDPLAAGDHPGAVLVDDLDTPALLRAVTTLNAGRDLAGNPLHGPTALLPGAVVNPNAADLDREIAWMERKVEAGASFFQTQTVYDPDAFERFLRRTEHLGVPVLATFIVPRSAEMARRMNRDVPGVCVPESMIRRLDAATDSVACAIELSAPVIARLAKAAQGLHLIAVGWEAHFAALLQAAGIDRKPA